MPDNLVTLKAGTGRSFAFVHPASGLVTAFRRLLPHLTGSGAVFALENPEPQQPPCSIDDLAADYWDQLADAAPGPLAIAGWSFGGAVAIDMASAAEAAGHHIAAVVLIDSVTPQLLRSIPPIPLNDLAGLFEIETSELPAGVSPVSDEEALDLIVAVLRRTRGLPEIQVADLRPFVDTYRWHLKVARRPWRPADVRAPVFLVRASDEPGRNDAPADLGWSSVLGTAPIPLWTPGTHHSLMSQEHAPCMAEVLVKILTLPDEPYVFTGGAHT